MWRAWACCRQVWLEDRGLFTGKVLPTCVMGGVLMPWRCEDREPAQEQPVLPRAHRPPGEPAILPLLWFRVCFPPESGCMRGHREPHSIDEETDSGRFLWNPSWGGGGRAGARRGAPLVCPHILIPQGTTQAGLQLLLSPQPPRRPPALTTCPERPDQRQLQAAGPLACISRQQGAWSRAHLCPGLLVAMGGGGRELRGGRELN